MVMGLGAESHPVTVEVATSAPLVTRLKLTGSVAASHRSQLSPRIPGLILKTHVDAGVMVKAGAVLMELDPELAELEFELMERELVQARIEAADAQRLLSEGSALAARRAFPQSEVASRKTSYEVKNALVSQIETRMKRQRSIIERHRLVTPYDGVISRRLADDGEWVQTGVPVVELVSLENPRLDVQVPQEYFESIRKDTKVTVKLDAFPGREFAGRVAAVVPVKDDVARTFLTRLEWEDAGNMAGPGMSGSAEFELRSSGPVVQVPRDAVVRSPDGGTMVWVFVEENGRRFVQSRDVVLGDSLGEKVQVIRGLEDAMRAVVRVVVRGNEALKDGHEVQVLPTTHDSDKK